MLQWWPPGARSQRCVHSDDGCCSKALGSEIRAESCPEGDWVKLPNYLFFFFFFFLIICLFTPLDLKITFCNISAAALNWWNTRRKCFPSFKSENPSSILVLKFLAQKVPASLFAAWSSPCLPTAAWPDERAGEQRRVLFDLLSWDLDLPKNKDPEAWFWIYTCAMYAVQESPAVILAFSVSLEYNGWPLKFQCLHYLGKPEKTNI